MKKDNDFWAIMTLIAIVVAIIIVMTSLGGCARPVYRFDNGHLEKQPRLRPGWAYAPTFAIGYSLGEQYKIGKR